MAFGEMFRDIMGGENKFRADAQGPDQLSYSDPYAMQNRGMLQRTLSADTQAPQASGVIAQGATIDPSQQAQFRAMQAGLAGQLSQTAAGQGPSLATLQAQQSLQQQLAAQASAAAGLGADQNPALARRSLAQQALQAGLGTAGQAMAGRLAEQQAAQQSLGGLLGQGRGQDVDLASQQAAMLQQTAMQNAGMAQQSSLANQQAMLQQRQLNQQQQQFAMGGLLDQAEADRQARMQWAGQDLQARLQNQQLNSGIAASNAQAAGALGQGLLGAAAMGGASYLGGLANRPPRA